jgi:DEAD/DEAH box helicase domain-containing protein
MYKDIPSILNSFPYRIIGTRNLPERKGSYSDIPTICDADLKKCLAGMGYEKLYSHQAEMFEEAIEGKNVIITTGTASGKSLAFYLPVIQRIIQNPARRALFLYPTKALTQDQQKGLQPFVDYFGEKKIKVGIYDGDTPASQRRKIREEANIILTNPDMINSSFLPNHNRYGFPHIFRNLNFIIIDELHAYRGAFGSHVSNVMKRLLRICKYHGNSPQFLCSSATIANPQELAENICHSSFIHVSKDGSPSPEKEIFFWQPPIVDYDKNLRRSIVEEIVELLPQLIENNVRVISFCTSRKETEIVSKECRDMLAGKYGSILANKISGYRGGYTPVERRRIEKDLMNGDILGVVSTNALELGIDIGALQMVIMGGFPATRASFWQQLGRAGRRGGKAYAVLMLKNRPTDQYVGINPDWLIGTSPENAVVDKNNLYIQLSHIRAAAAELPLTIDDRIYFPDLGEVLPLLQKIGEINEIHNTFHWKGTSSPAHEISLRNITSETVQVFDKENEKTLTTIDIKQAKRELYTGAIYLHDTIQYKCLELNLAKKIANVEAINLNYYTDPEIGTGVDILATHEENEVGRTKVVFGDVNVATMIAGYKMIQFFNHQNLGYESLPEPLQYEMDTEGCSVELPDNVTKVLLKLNQSIKNENTFCYFDGLVHSLKSVAELKVMATFSDIDGSHFEYTKTAEQKQSNGTAVILYDQYPGGLGFAEKIFQNIEEIINNAIDLVMNCRCQTGCPVCVGDHKIDKKIILWALENFFAETKPPKDIVIFEEPKIASIEYPYTWENISEDWAKLVRLIQDRRMYGADFISTAREIRVNNTTLTLYFPESDVKLADKYEIKQSIVNNLKQFIKLPDKFSLSFESIDSIHEDRKHSKLIRHFQREGK